MARTVLLLSLASFVALSGPAFCDPEDDGTTRHNSGIANQFPGDPLPLLGKLKWDATRAEVRAMFPGVEDGEPAPGDAAANRQFRLRAFALGGCTFTLSFAFFDATGRLKDVIGRYDGRDADNCQQKTHDGFDDRFGVHPQLVIGNGAEERTDSLVWSGDVTTIWLDTTTDTATDRTTKFRFVLQRSDARGSITE
jgi:hypothetical protein